jgi:DNA-binding CsgD family transcriptional regulator
MIKLSSTVDSLHEEFATDSVSTSFALTQLRNHGTPYVLLCDSAGRLHAADVRPGWRAFFDVDIQHADRLPDALWRLLARHRARQREDTTTVALLDHDVVVTVVSLRGPEEAFAFSLWHVRRDEAIAAARRRYSLTEREGELLAHILRGASSAEIGKVLSISLATVEWHTKRLLFKTDSQNRTQMAARVLGWIPDAS